MRISELIKNHYSESLPGQEVVSNCGKKLKLIAYRNSNDVDILFDDKYIIKGKRYQAFRNGEIKCPMVFEPFPCDKVLNCYMSRSCSRKAVRCLNPNVDLVFLICEMDVVMLTDGGFLWNYAGRPGNEYVRCSKNGIRFYNFDGTELLHRLIMRPTKDEKIDHKDGNRLDNRRCNLRHCTQSQNACNKVRQSNNRTGFTGVCSPDQYGYHRCQVMLRVGNERKRYHLGMFKDPIEAAQLYNMAALVYHGEFATLNEIPINNGYDREVALSNLCYISQFPVPMIGVHLCNRELLYNCILRETMRDISPIWSE